MVNRTVIKDKQYFEDHVERLPWSGCWIWDGYTTPRGYGTLRAGGKKRQAHRVAYGLWHGEPPQDKLVCHHCDTPPCVNPNHLFLGTAKDNTQDALRKKRMKPHGKPMV